MPRVHVHSATPKGGRVDEMIDALSQVGAAAWSPLRTARGVVDPRDTKMERLERIAIEASKQCGRAWKLELGAAKSLDDVLHLGGRVLVADASGQEYEDRGRTDEIHLLVGPEGGWTVEEIEAMRRAGTAVVRFGPHVMRIETAAVVGVGVILRGV